MGSEDLRLVVSEQVTNPCRLKARRDEWGAGRSPVRAERFATCVDRPLQDAVERVGVKILVIRFKPGFADSDRATFSEAVGCNIVS